MSSRVETYREQRLGSEEHPGRKYISLDLIFFWWYFQSARQKSISFLCRLWLASAFVHCDCWAPPSHRVRLCLHMLPPLTPSLPLRKAFRMQKSFYWRIGIVGTANYALTMPHSSLPVLLSYPIIPFISDELQNANHLLSNYEIKLSNIF
jgi:hypothetical protein